MAEFAGWLGDLFKFVFFFLIGKKQYIDRKRIESNHKVHEREANGEQRGNTKLTKRP